MKFFRASVLSLLLFGGALAACAANFGGWSKTMPITFSGYGKAESLTNFPVLVTLGTALPGFSYADFASPSDGADLRFAAGNQVDELNYEIEKWDPAGTSYVWVQVPLLAGTNTRIWALWGNPGAAAPAYATNGLTWDASELGVWHMAQSNALDSTTNRFHGTSTGTVTQVSDGVIAGADEFDAPADFVQIPDSPRFTLSGAYTVSAWIRPDPSTNWQSFIGTYSGSTNGFIFAVDTNAGNRLEFWANGSGWRTNAVGIPDGVWSHVAYTRSGTAGRFYVNGTVTTNITNAGPGGNGGPLQISAGGTNWPTQRFDGRIDEIRLTEAARSSNWIWAAWMNTASNGTFGAYGSAGAGALSVQTLGATPIGSTNAMLNGVVVYNGGEPATEAYFCWDNADKGSASTGDWAHVEAAGNSFTNGQPVSALINGLLAGSTYVYRCYATNSTGASWSSSAQSFTPLSMTVSATAGDRQVSLVWSNVASATGYQVGNSVTSGGPYTVVATDLTTNGFVHTGLQNGITNYYVITASIPIGDVVSTQVFARPWVAVLRRAINCGGPAVGSFSADTNYSGGYLVSTTSNINLTAVTDPAPEAVYQTGRSGGSTYIFSPFSRSRQYRVRVHYAEIEFAARASFHAYLNDAAGADVYLRSYINLTAWAGGVNKAVIDVGNITPSLSGQIKFKTTQGGIVNAIEVYALDGPMPLANVYPRDSRIVIDMSIALDTETITISRATTSGGPYTVLGENVPGTVYTDTNVTNGTTYYYKLTGRSSWGETDYEYAVTPGLLCYAINVNGYRIGRFVPENATYTRNGGTAVQDGVNVPSIPFGTKDPAESAYLYNYLRTGAQTNVFGGLLPGETYLIRLHLYEHQKTAVGQRVFHVDVNGTRKLTSLDIFSEVGKIQALVKEFTATADGTGKISINLVAVTDQPTISGIEIRQQSGVMTPQVPLGVTASGQPYFVALTWTVPAWGNSYTIWRSATAGGPYSVLATNVYSDSYIDFAPADGVRFYYRVVGEVNGVAVESSQSAEVNAVSTIGATQTGLSVQYFAGFTTDGVGERLALGGEVAPTLQTNWGTGNIGSAAVGDRNAKVVWNGNVMLNRNATYTFYAKAVGGIRVWVTNVCVIDKWNQPLAGEYASGTFSAAGITGFYNLRVEYYNTTGSAEAVLEWEAPAVWVPRSVIPTGYLRPVALGDPGKWVFRDVAMAFPGYGEMSAVPGRMGLHGAGTEGIANHQFACQQVTGPFELTARAAYYNYENTYYGHWFYRMGLAIRSSLTGTNGFAYGLMRGSGDSKVYYNNNLAVSGVYSSTVVAGQGIPVYLRMRREKTDGVFKISAAYSANGTTWTTNFNSTTGSTERTVYAGMAMGVPESVLMYGYFDNIELRLLKQPGTVIFIR